MVPSHLLANSGTNSYTIGSMSYISLYQLLGKDLFTKCLAAYMNDWKHKHPTPYDFMNTFNRVSGKDLNWFWKQWYFDWGYMDLALTDYSNGTVTVENLGGRPMAANLIDLRFERRRGPQVQRIDRLDIVVAVDDHRLAAGLVLVLRGDNRMAVGRVELRGEAHAGEFRHQPLGAGFDIAGMPRVGGNAGETQEGEQILKLRCHAGESSRPLPRPARSIRPGENLAFTRDYTAPIWSRETLVSLADPVVRIHRAPFPSLELGMVRAKIHRAPLPDQELQLLVRERIGSVYPVSGGRIRRL